MNNQQVPIPDFREFVEYRRTIDEPSKGPSHKSGLGNGMKWMIGIVFIIAAATIFYSLMKTDAIPASSVLSQSVSTEKAIEIK